jgi:hypothetical protein
MNQKADALYEAHVAYVLRNFQPDKLPTLIRDEAGFIWDQLDSVRLGDVLSKQEILDFQKRNFEHRQRMSAPARTYAHSLRDAIVEHLRANKTSLSDVIEKKDYDRLVKEISQLKDIREQLIHAVVSNPLYGEVIANILADGIKSFTSEEGFAGKIPGASSLFKMGSGLLGGLQDSIDKNVRKFIADNIQKLTGSSEKFVRDLLNDRKVAELGEKLWQKTSGKPVGDAVKRFQARDLEPFEPVVEDLVNQALRSPFAAGINEVIIDHFLKEKGGLSLQALLLEIEVTRDDVVRESEEFFSKVFAVSLKDGSLETRIRKHLKDFYGSPEVAGILS